MKTILISSKKDKKNFFEGILKGKNARKKTHLWAICGLVYTGRGERSTGSFPYAFEKKKKC